MAADGSVLIDVDANTSKAEQKLAKMKGDISKLEDELKKKETEKSGLQQELNNIEQAAADAYKQLDTLTKERDRLNKTISSSFTGDYANTPEAINAYEDLDSLNKQIAAQEKVVAAMDKQSTKAANIEAKINRITAEITEGRAKLEEASVAAGKVQQQIDYASSAAGRFESASDKASTVMQKFEKRLGGLAKRVFIFSVFTAALRGVRNWLGDVVKQNEEASAAVSQLKASLTQMAQPLLNVVIPAFVFLTNVLTALVQMLGSFFSLLFGAGDAADALYDQADAMNEVGGAAGKASKQLASFDTINKLTAGGGGGGGGKKLNLAEATALNNKFREIAAAALSIGAAVAGWNISRKFGGGLSTAAAVAALLGSSVLFIYEYLVMWNEGVDLSSLSKALIALSGIIGSLYVLFGKKAAAIAMVTGGLALFVLGVKDAIKNGMNFENLLTMIAGLLAAGLGIGIMTGSWIPMLIAGIGSILLAITYLTGNGNELIGHLKEAFDGLMQFITNIFSGNVEEAMEGLAQFFKGIGNSIITVMESVINAIIKGINWLIEKINGLSFRVPEWIPGVGGKSWSPDLKKKLPVTLPRLAQGAVIPPNQEFLAVLGDQRSGTNIEAPLSTIKQAVLEAMAQTGGGNKTIVLQVDGREFASIVFDMFNLESQRLGVESN